MLVKILPFIFRANYHSWQKKLITTIVVLCIVKDLKFNNMRSERFEKLIACKHTGAYIENDIAFPSQIKLLKVYRAQASCPC
jgi:hypothetical protein